MQIRTVRRGRKRYNCEACLRIRHFLSGDDGIDLKGGTAGGHPTCTVVLAGKFTEKYD